MVLIENNVCSFSLNLIQLHTATLVSDLSSAFYARCYLPTSDLELTLGLDRSKGIEAK